MQRTAWACDMPVGGTVTIAIVVGTYNRLSQLRELVASIDAQTKTPFEIHITDAGSSDGTVEWLGELAQRDKRVHVTLEGQRRGQAAALNSVFKSIRTPYTCWLSDDNIVVNSSIDTAVAALQSNSRLGMVGLKVRDLRGPFARAPYIGGITGIGVLNINQGVIHTDLLNALGGFDETYRDYGIDADLTTRVLLAGRSVALTRTVGVLHQRNWPSPDTDAALYLAERDHQYKHRYMSTYGPALGRDLGWLITRALWKMIRHVMPGLLDLDSPRPVLGHLVKDWHNMITGRFISIWREFGSCGPVHLVQSCPKRMLENSRDRLGVAA